MKEVIRKINNKLIGLKPENRFGVIADMNVNAKDPRYTVVTLDRGKRDARIHGVHQELREVIIPTKDILTENWNIQDLIYVGLLGTINRVASIQELREIGASVDEIYERFVDWVEFRKKASEYITIKPKQGELNMTENELS